VFRQTRFDGKKRLNRNTSSFLDKTVVKFASTQI
jgi:hypothetical protein